jgi:uncharacterized OB-fold protein
MESIQKPLPEVDSTNAPFFESVAAGRLAVQRCRNCGRHQLYPKPWCAACGSLELDWTDAGPEGVVYSFTVIRRVIGNSKDFERETPYAVGVVELKEGVRVYARLLAKELPSISIGKKAVFQPLKVGEKLGLPYFSVVTDQ